jgi:carbonic anhydrase
MNISPSNIVGTCNLKCAYSFNYPTTNVTASNYGTYIGLNFDPSTTPPVTYNTENYTVNGMYIFSPSLHLFNGNQAVGEILIIHSPVLGGQPLYVCIPISGTGITNNASPIISQIINAVSSGAPSANESTTQGIDQFSLNTIIPKSEYYSYTASSGLNVIVYSTSFSIGITADTLAILQKVIQTEPSEIFPSGSALYVNPDGPSSSGGSGDGQIYIDCQPTGSSDNDTEVEGTKVTPTRALINNDLGKLWPIFMFFLYAIICIVIIIFLNKGIIYLTGNTKATAASKSLLN